MIRGGIVYFVFKEVIFIKKLGFVVVVFVLLLLVFQSTYFREMYYRGKIERAETVDVEMGADLNATLSDEQLSVIQELLIDTDWKKTKEDLSTTEYLMFDNDLLVGILDASAEDLTIGIGRHQFLLEDVEVDIYSVIFGE